MKKILKEHWVRYAWSTLITFLAGFALAVIPLLDELNFEKLSWSALAGVLFAGARLGVKMVLEVFLAWYSKRKK